MSEPGVSSFARALFLGEIHDELAFPYPMPDEAEQEKALALDGARVYDPAESGRLMRGWVEVPFAHATKWAGLAETALRLRKETSG